jgi:hypothetical protein
MNIKNRLSKLQKLTNVGGGFCACPSTRKVETYWADLGVESNDPTPQLYGSPVADNCSVCRKPIKKEQIIIQGVDHTTKDRFPEEWESSK